MDLEAGQPPRMGAPRGDLLGERRVVGPEMDLAASPGDQVRQRRREGASADDGQGHANASFGMWAVRFR